ncbi:hypothetical protein Pla100_44860 [Neorhodopirellula pilleata]|uniref:Uncharacterized protein n=1 Tax=Neorhodopirellula pilleata TaxID=2714738 RepID=A0A5C6A0R7_9BACT|nr:hypothetical protein Pla100_44860 [Neorhodopirellula pilleata]
MQAKQSGGIALCQESQGTLERTKMQETQSSDGHRLGTWWLQSSEWLGGFRRITDAVTLDGRLGFDLLNRVSRP